ncbi:TPA: hypothetical protein ACPVYZ_004274 [Vibrio parahaemolyticus]
MELNQFLNGGAPKGYKVKRLYGNGMKPALTAAVGASQAWSGVCEYIRTTVSTGFAAHTMTIQARAGEKCMLTSLFVDHTSYPTGVRKLVIDGVVVYDNVHLSEIASAQNDPARYSNGLLAALSRPFSRAEIVLQAKVSSSSNSTLSFAIAWCDVVEDK